jgi:hypothetical protein
VLQSPVHARQLEEENIRKYGCQPREISGWFVMMDGLRFAVSVTPALPGSFF